MYINRHIHLHIYIYMHTHPYSCTHIHAGLLWALCGISEKQGSLGIFFTALEIPLLFPADSAGRRKLPERRRGCQVPTSSQFPKQVLFQPVESYASRQRPLTRDTTSKNCRQVNGRFFGWGHTHSLFRPIR